LNAKRSWKAEFERQFYVDPNQPNELLLGCGSERSKRIIVPDTQPEWRNLVTLDMNEDMSPTVIHDMNHIPLPFAENTFDEVHAYEVLEHTGIQGDFRFFLQQFADFWRVLKPGGFFCGSVPMWDSPWAWGDPGHTRVITSGSLVFLSQDEYTNQVGKTSMTDYRRWYQANFETMGVQEKEHQMSFVLKAHK
jgi:SAM-dependent methyltransferase